MGGRAGPLSSSRQPPLLIVNIGLYESCLDRLGIAREGGILGGFEIFTSGWVRCRATRTRSRSGRLATFHGVDAASLEKRQQYEANHHEGSPHRPTDDGSQRSSTCLGDCSEFGHQENEGEEKRDG